MPFPLSPLLHHDRTVTLWFVRLSRLVKTFEEFTNDCQHPRQQPSRLGRH